jgi:hypothetical protein
LINVTKTAEIPNAIRACITQILQTNTQRIGIAHYDKGIRAGKVILIDRNS